MILNRDDERHRNFQGGLLIVGSMAIIGLIDNFIPFISAEAGLWQFHFFRSSIGVPVLIILILARGRSLKPLRPKPLLLRSAILAASMLLYFGSLALMPIAEAGAGLFAAPIFVLLFAAMFFGARIGIWRVAAVLVGFGGVLLVLKPDISNLDIVVLFPLFAAVFYGFGQLMTRHYCSQEDTLVVLLAFYFVIGICGMMGSLYFTLWPAPASWQAAMPFFTSGWVAPTPMFLFWVSLQSIGSLVGVAGLIRGYQISDPTYLGVFEYSFLLFAGIWGWLLWHHIPDAISMIGMVAIVASGIAIALRSRGVRRI